MTMQRREAEWGLWCRDVNSFTGTRRKGEPGEGTAALRKRPPTERHGFPRSEYGEEQRSSAKHNIKKIPPAVN